MSEAKIEIHPGETFYRAYCRVHLNEKVKQAMVVENAKPINDRRNEKVVRAEIFAAERNHYIQWCAVQGKIIKERDPDLCKKVLVDAQTSDARKFTVVSRGSKTKAIIEDPKSGEKKTYHMYEKVPRKKLEPGQVENPNKPGKKMPVWIAWRNSPTYTAIKNRVFEENKSKGLSPSEMRKLIDLATGKACPEYVQFKIDNYPSAAKIQTP